MGTRVVVIGPDKPVYNERTATEAITPGMLVNPVAAGTVEKNDLTGDGNGTVEVAVENDIFGGGIDDDYAIGDTVISQILRPGCEFMGLLAASATAVVFDDYITLAAGGFVAKGTRANAIGMAREAVDNSGGATPARLRVAVI
jgi:hypothetical protein